MSGVSGAMLQIQASLVNWFHRFAIDEDVGVAATLGWYGLEAPTDPPPVTLYDEPPAGLASFYRIGNASVDIETGDGRLLWSIDQELEAHVDPVRGRAAVLAMSDVLERAFAPTRPTVDPHRGIGLYLEQWLNYANLTLPDPCDPPRILVTEMTQTDARIGYSEAGLTYQVISTWNILAQPL